MSNYTADIMLQSVTKEVKSKAAECKVCNLFLRGGLSQRRPVSISQIWLNPRRSIMKRNMRKLSSASERHEEEKVSMRLACVSYVITKSDGTLDGPSSTRRNSLQQQQRKCQMMAYLREFSWFNDVRNTRAHVRSPAIGPAGALSLTP